ncbi:MAG: hypothetical protein ACI9MR_000977 [Myxococcota bacterium]
MQSHLNHTFRAGALACIFTLAAACGDDGAATGTTDDTTEDTAPLFDTGDTTALPGDTARDSTQDTDQPDSGAPDDAEVTDAGGDIGPSCGDFGEGCVESDDCCSGWCLQGAIGSQCTQTCIEQCPDGWECRLLSNVGPDPVSLCVDVTLVLCQPCRTDADCSDVSVNSPNVCLDYGDEGSFCGLNCSDAAGYGCPDGYSCETVAGAADDAMQQCRKDDDVCECNDASKALDRDTDCNVVNSVGVCPGERRCAPAGLTSCQGEAASLETCDGVDEDCDGETDEDVAPSVCEVSNDFGTCSGMTTCLTPGANGCNAPVPAAEVCNGVDDDCNSETDEETDASCFPYACAGTAGCATSCATQADCGQGFFCDVNDVDDDNNSAECLAQRDGGDICSDDSADFECGPGFCNGGYCCGEADGDCCGSVLDCQQLAGERVCTLAALGGCVGERTDGLCDPETNICRANVVSDPGACAGDVCADGSCGDDFFTEPTRCNGQGACVLGGDVESCSDTNVCTLDSCDAVQGCVNAPVEGETSETCYSFEPTFQQGVGECRAGLVACSGGSVVTCSGQQGPSTEVCNGRDDDCDSFTDDGADECFPYGCKGQLGCGTSCSQHTDCADDYFCDFLDADGDNNRSECLPSLVSGDACNDAFECPQGDFCNNGFCCDSPTGDCCGSNVDCNHLAGTPQCLNSTSCQGERVDASCDANSVCNVQTIADPGACAGLTCQGGACNGLIASSGKACDGQGLCATSLGTTNCQGNNNFACSYSCVGAGECVGVIDEILVEIACFIVGNAAELGFVCECYPD